jgi:acyl carrier protein
MTTLRDELLDLISAEALIDRAKLAPSATLADLGLDSVGVVSIVFAVEDKYGVEIAEDAFNDAPNLDAFLGRLETIIRARQDAILGRPEG